MSQVQVPVPEGSALSSASSGQRFSCQGPPSVRLEPVGWNLAHFLSCTGGAWERGPEGALGGGYMPILGGSTEEGTR